MNPYFSAIAQDANAAMHRDGMIIAGGRRRMKLSGSGRHRFCMVSPRGTKSKRYLGYYTLVCTS